MKPNFTGDLALMVVEVGLRVGALQYVSLGFVSIPVTSRRATTTKDDTERGGRGRNGQLNTNNRYLSQTVSRHRWTDVAGATPTSA